MPFPEAAERAGIRTDRRRYHDALADMEYEGVIEWDASAPYARGDKHHVVTRRGLDYLNGAEGATQEEQEKLFEHPERNNAFSA